MTLVSRGYLHAGQWADTAVTLAAGHAYQIHMRPDDCSVDFDLSIYDENLNLVGLDDSFAPGASAVLRPAWTGVFHLRVSAARGSGYFSLYI